MHIVLWHREWQAFNETETKAKIIQWRHNTGVKERKALSGVGGRTQRAWIRAVLHTDSIGDLGYIQCQFCIAKISNRISRAIHGTQKGGSVHNQWKQSVSYNWEVSFERKCISLKL